MKLSELSFGACFTLDETPNMLYFKLNLPVRYADNSMIKPRLYYQTFRVCLDMKAFSSTIYLYGDEKVSPAAYA